MAEKRGVKARVKLVEAFFREVLSKNAGSPSEVPMVFKDMKALVKNMLYAQGLPAIPIPDHKHYMDSQGGAFAGGYETMVDNTPRDTPRGRRRDRVRGFGGTVPDGFPQAPRGAYDGVPSRGAGDGFPTPRAGDGGPPRGAGGGAMAASMAAERVGRFPRNFRLGITSAGKKICMAYQQKKCVRQVIYQFRGD